MTLWQGLTVNTDINYVPASTGLRNDFVRLRDTQDTTNSYPDLASYLGVWLRSHKISCGDECVSISQLNSIKSKHGAVCCNFLINSVFWSCAEISLSLSRLSVWDSISRPRPASVGRSAWSGENTSAPVRSWWQSGLCWRYLLSPLDPGKYNNCCSVTQK